MRTLRLIGAVLALSACSPSLGVLSIRDAEPLVIRAGTSFGHCLGYCSTTLEIEGTEAVLTRESRNPEKDPPRIQRLQITRKEWERLVAVADTKAFSGLQEVYGCPDCADGGAEWIELERQGSRQRVTFEYGDTIAVIAPLILEIREIRGRFPEPS